MQTKSIDCSKKILKSLVGKSYTTTKVCVMLHYKNLLLHHQEVITQMLLYDVLIQKRPF